MIITAILRLFQIIFAAIVLALSISLIRSQDYGTVAAQNYAAFTGGFGLLVALMGVAAIFIEPLAGFIQAGADALAALFFIAGGIAIAVMLSGINCSSKSDSNQEKLINNKLTTGGCVRNNKGSETDCGFTHHGSSKNGQLDWLLGRCKENSADAAFMLISAVMCLGLGVMSLLALRRGGGRKGVIA
ncbi:hypothetical protein K490DRAFT_54850 [Saccharata proteae CBS 121410]|uniref:MARVEL domain-containing protein n=1 Tax=Saccharata proteae CBS 121410 TaxID=1314787 RepID=A0A6A5YEJ6_9PEZI|nr:hypothetical protein K490DRAFT_54850 [Saccharata proteae CBS 121410]